MKLDMVFITKPKESTELDLGIESFFSFQALA